MIDRLFGHPATTENIRGSLDLLTEDDIDELLPEEMLRGVARLDYFEQAYKLRTGYFSLPEGTLYTSMRHDIPTSMGALSFGNLMFRDDSWLGRRRPQRLLFDVPNGASTELIAVKGIGHYLNGGLDLARAEEIADAISQASFATDTPQISDVPSQTS